ncbi:MAG: M48 family metallopeptidase [Reyranellaceae bacterium]
MASEPASIDFRLSERDIAIALRRSARARRISLRVSPRSGALELVLPARASLAAGLRFAATQARWIERHAARLIEPCRLQPGIVLPLAGIDHEVTHDPAARGVRHDVGTRNLLVGGDPLHAPRRLRDFLARQARQAVTPLAHEKAARIGRRIARLSIRDSRTRWGSCSSGGGLSFTWRLALTPPSVVDYLAAHEVAHLEEMNHGPRFWRLCASLAEHDLDQTRAWLRQNGGRILSFGL